MPLIDWYDDTPPEFAENARKKFAGIVAALSAVNIMLPPTRHVAVPLTTSMVCVKNVFVTAAARIFRPAVPVEVFCAMTVVVVGVELNA